jgi:hypothetical protein
MSRKVCFFDEETGQHGTCLNESESDLIDCTSCDHNPFPGKTIPEDRVLRKKRIQFEYELLTDGEYAEMMAGRGSNSRTIWYRGTNKRNSRCFHHRHNVRR